MVGREFLFVLDGFGEELGFDDGEAVEAPLGGDQLMNEVELGGAVGMEVVEVGEEELVELGGVLGGEHESLGGEAVFERVLGRAEAAGFGFGSVGFCAVGAGGLGFGWHMGLGGEDSGWDGGSAEATTGKRCGAGELEWVSLVNGQEMMASSGI